MPLQQTAHISVALDLLLLSTRALIWWLESTVDSSVRQVVLCNIMQDYCSPSKSLVLLSQLAEYGLFWSFDELKFIVECGNEETDLLV